MRKRYNSRCRKDTVKGIKHQHQSYAKAYIESDNSKEDGDKDEDYHKKDNDNRVDEIVKIFTNPKRESLFKR